jgi:hypothetical protein
MRLRFLFVTLACCAGWIACGSDTSTSTTKDGGADASLDVSSDTTQPPPQDSGSSQDAADSAYFAAPCDPNNDMCMGAKKCCQIAGKSADGGPNFGCVLMKPPDNICPPVM